MSRLNEIRELTRVRVLTFLREPEAIFWVFVFPIVLAAVLGFAFRSSVVEPTAIGLVDSVETDAYVAMFEVDEEIELDICASREDGLLKVRGGAGGAGRSRRAADAAV